MAISGKPQKAAPTPSPAPLPDEDTVRKLIHRGGSVAEAQRPEESARTKLMLVQLRLHPDLVAEIDAHREKSPKRRGKSSSRHEWIVQAIEAKLHGSDKT